MQDNHKFQLPIVLSFLDDARRLIEGGKGRRWEVFKWTMALNVVLATAALTQPKPPIAWYGLLVLALAVSLMGGFLIDHYDRRMTKARERALAAVPGAFPHPIVTTTAASSTSAHFLTIRHRGHGPT